MKKIYYLSIALLFIGVNTVIAQTCPTSLGNQSTLSTIHFKISSGTCNDYADYITIEGVRFDKLSCNGTNLKYQITTSDIISSSSTFLVTFGDNELNCQYVNGQLVTLSNNNIAFDKLVAIYPNPVKGDNLNLKIDQPIMAQINIFNVTGKRVLSDEIINSYSKSIDVSALNNGIFILQITTDKASTTRKVILMK